MRGEVKKEEENRKDEALGECESPSASAGQTRVNTYEFPALLVEHEHDKY